MDQKKRNKVCCYIHIIFYQYYDSNTGILSIAPHVVAAFNSFTSFLWLEIEVRAITKERAIFRKQVKKIESNIQKTSKED